MDDFLDRYFQESAEPMREYYRILASDVPGSKKHGVRFLARRPNTRFNIDLPIDARRAGELRRIFKSAVRLAKKPVVKRRLEREAQALRKYETDERIESLLSQYKNNPAPGTLQSLLETIDNANAHYKQVREIITYTGRQHWLKNINKHLPK